MKVFDYITEFNSSDWKLLDDLVELLDDGNTAVDVVAQHFLGTANIFRVGEGLVVTQTVSEGARRELIVYGLIGRGMLRHADEVCHDLKLVAKEFGCSSIGGNVTRPGLKRLYDKLGAKPVSVYYQLELG